MGVKNGFIENPSVGSHTLPTSAPLQLKLIPVPNRENGILKRNKAE
jgi:hypothetical protein